LRRKPRINSKGAKTGYFWANARARRERIFRGAVATTLSSGGALMIWASISWADAAPAASRPRPPIRPPSSSETQPGGGTPPPSIATPLAPQPADAECFAELRANHIEAEIVPAPPAPLADCGIAEPVCLSSIGLPNGAPIIDMPDHPILDSAFALTFTEFAQDLMAPLATAMLGSGIVALATRATLAEARSGSRAAIRTHMPRASPLIFRQSRWPIGDVSPSAMKRIPRRPCSRGQCGKPPAAGSPPCWGRARTRPTPSTSISTSCDTEQATTIASASSRRQPFAGLERS